MNYDKKIKKGKKERKEKDRKKKRMMIKCTVIITQSNSELGFDLKIVSCFIEKDHQQDRLESGLVRLLGKSLVE